MAVSAIIISSNDPNAAILIKPGDGKDELHRLRSYIEWLANNGMSWNTPDLAAYRDHLLTTEKTITRKDGSTRTQKPLAPASVQAHLATIRGRYADLMKNNQVRDALYQVTPTDASAADKKAFVDEALTRLKNGVDADNAKVDGVIKEKDQEDGKHLRLTKVQADRLIDAPFTRRQNTPLQAIRDSAMIALMLCTGIREMELVNLQVADLRTGFGGELSLRVRKGKGCTARSIPYGELSWCLSIVDAWLKAAGITEGIVFRGFYKGGKRIREVKPSKNGKMNNGVLTLCAVNQMLDRYPITIEGKQRTVNPHDLRRTYARRLYEAGMLILGIQQNMGHADHSTTEKYIGNLDSIQRRSPDLYSFDPDRLKGYIL